MASSSAHLPNIIALLLLFLFLSLSSLALSQKCHPNDEKALLQFKKDLKNPPDLTTWLPNTNCCNWSHLKCDNKTNRITEITLAGGNHHLPIPSAIGDIQSLQTINLDGNSFTGPVPQSISKLSHLDLLLIQRNLLTGPIPSFLGNLKKLTYINLSQNKLTGSIPASLSQLPLLRVLLLDHNKLTGRVPETFGDFKAKDFVLDLSDNLLSGPIPASLGRVKLFVLRVTGNRLSGDLSFMFVKNQSLELGSYSRNLFKFDFSKAEFSDQLFTLELEENQIYGTLPPAMATSALSFLNVSYNNLCGRIPVGGNLQNPGSTDYSHNRCLCGTPLPECK